nr:MAG TPA: hypothetical protein [Caudoviricetes sp.]DAH70477.1 MAG TPA: hypothetical protein [Caudoviricetes sp.]
MPVPLLYYNSYMRILFCAFYQYVKELVLLFPICT